MNVVELLLALLLIAIGAVAYFTKGIMDDTKGLRAEMQPITPAIVEIQGKFRDAGHNLLFPLTVAPGSALKLTEYGEKLMKDSGFDKILQKNNRQLVDAVKVKNPKSNYDIQQFSKQLIHELFENDNEMFRPLKEFAFNNGMNVKVLVPPAGVLLRDEVMKELKFK